MDRTVVIDRTFEVLEPGGGFATLGHAGAAERLHPWRLAADAVIERYLGARQPSHWRNPDWERHEVVLRPSRLATVEVERVETSRTASVDDLVGRVFSISGSAPERLGARLERFEVDLRRALLEVEPGGVFALRDSFEYALAVKS